MEVAHVSLQLCHRHTGQRDRVARINHDHRSRREVMRLIENLLCRRVRKHCVIKRNHVLAYFEVRDRFFPKTRVEDERIGAAITGKRIVWTANQHIVARAACQQFVGCWCVERNAGGSGLRCFHSGRAMFP